MGHTTDHFSVQLILLLSCRFPKDAELRQKWLAVAQRDEGSLRTNSFLCSKHFGSSCFMLNEEGLLTLSPDAVPTISPVGGKGDEVTQHAVQMLCLETDH